MSNQTGPSRTMPFIRLQNCILPSMARMSVKTLLGLSSGHAALKPGPHRLFWGEESIRTIGGIARSLREGGTMSQILSYCWFLSFYSFWHPHSGPNSICTLLFPSLSIRDKSRVTAQLTFPSCHFPTNNKAVIISWICRRVFTCFGVVFAFRHWLVCWHEYILVQLRKLRGAAY